MVGIALANVGFSIDGRRPWVNMLDRRRGKGEDRNGTQAETTAAVAWLAWHWRQTDCWYYTPPDTKKRVPLVDDGGKPIRGKDNRQAAVRVSFRWLGIRKSVTNDQRSVAADVFGAEGKFLSVGKKLLDNRHPAFKAVTAVRN